MYHPTVASLAASDACRTLSTTPSATLLGSPAALPSVTSPVAPTSLQSIILSPDGLPVVIPPPTPLTASSPSAPLQLPRCQLPASVSSDPPFSSSPSFVPSSLASLFPCPYFALPLGLSTPRLLIPLSSSVRPSLPLPSWPIPSPFGSMSLPPLLTPLLFSPLPLSFPLTLLRFIRYTLPITVLGYYVYPTTPLRFLITLLLPLPSLSILYLPFSFVLLLLIPSFLPPSIYLHSSPCSSISSPFVSSFSFSSPTGSCSSPALCLPNSPF
ncbi:hypothetical protein AMTRI_Chr03g144190 [Amborella trichopoda]